jgi:hypothetical protein
MISSFSFSFKNHCFRNWVHIKDFGVHMNSYISCGVLHVHLMWLIQNHPHAPHAPTTFIHLSSYFLQLSLSLFFILSFFIFHFFHTLLSFNINGSLSGSSKTTYIINFWLLIFHFLLLLLWCILYTYPTYKAKILLIK